MTSKKNIRDKSTRKTTEQDTNFWLSPSRLLGLSDGVIAIAITILAIKLIPELHHTHGDLLAIGPELSQYAVGFLSLGIYWVLHHHIFHIIKRADGSLMWLNILFLAFASLVPFWIAYININEGSDEAMFYYGVALTLTILTLLFIWIYAASGHRLVSKALGKNIINGYTKFMVFFLIVTIIIFVGNVMIPALKNVSWIFSLIFFIYMTTEGYKRFLILNKMIN